MRVSKDLNGVSCTFQVVRRKHQKRLIVTPLAPHHYRVSVPRHTSRAALEAMLFDHAQTILNLKHYTPPLKRMIEAKRVFIFGQAYRLVFSTVLPTAHCEEVLTIHVRDEAMETCERALSRTLKEWLAGYIDTLVDQYDGVFPAMQAAALTLVYRTMKTKFGSCRPDQKRITLNIELIHYPKPLIESIFLHEITHLKHPDHSQHFYATLLTLSPEYKTLKKALDSARKKLLDDALQPYRPTEQLIP